MTPSCFCRHWKTHLTSTVNISYKPFKKTALKLGETFTLSVNTFTVPPLLALLLPQMTEPNRVWVGIYQLSFILAAGLTWTYWAWIICCHQTSRYPLFMCRQYWPSVQTGIWSSVCAPPLIQFDWLLIYCVIDQKQSGCLWVGRCLNWLNERINEFKKIDTEY